jgi:hypothetical protein
VYLWTIDALTAAAHVYRSAGLRVTEWNAGVRWGVQVVEERYDPELRPAL